MVTAIIALLLGTGALATPPTHAADRRLEAAAVDSYVAAAMQSRRVPGLALAIVEGDRVVSTHGFGYADATGRPVTPATQFRIGSNTKGFTALAVMQLVEQGKVALEAPIRQYLPGFRLADDKAAGQITVAHLLYHTSGIPGEAGYDTFRQPHLTLGEYVQRLSGVCLDRPVGSAFEYSNANYNVLGLLVEAVSRESYAGYVQRHIFAPLRMTHSSAAPLESPGGGMAQGYKWWFGWPRPATDLFSAANAPAGYVTSTAEDLSHYLVAQMNDGRYQGASVLSPAGIVRIHAEGAHTRFAAHGVEVGYAMGWGIADLDGSSIVTHTGATFAFASEQIIDMRRRLAVVVLTNVEDQLSSDEHVRAIASGVLRRLSGLPPASKGLSAARVYLLIDPVLLILSIAGFVTLLRVLFRLGLAARSEPPQGRRLTAIRAAVEVSAAVFVVALVPRILGISWSLLLTAQPDLAWWALGMEGLAFLTGSIRTAALGVGVGERAAVTRSVGVNG